MIEILIACMFLGLPIIGMVCWLVSVFEHDGPLLGIIATTIIIFFVGGAGYMFYDQYKSRNELIMIKNITEKENIVAIAAYASGQFAEGRGDYKKALDSYKKSYVLQQDNDEYYTALMRVQNILGKDK